MVLQKEKNCKIRVQKITKKEAFAMDFGRDISLPDISTSEVYFRRQLSFYLFNVHVLANGMSVFYTYDQTEGNKGANDVVSMLNHFIENYLDPSVEELTNFCDSCGGQNKNFTVFRYLHHITTEKNIVTVVFPIRGHSYMEPDKNMGLLLRHSDAETPQEFREVIQLARVKPSPFEVVSFNREDFKQLDRFLSSKYSKKLNTPTRPIKELRIHQNKIRTIEHRDTYTSPFLSTVVLPPQRRSSKKRQPHKLLSIQQIMFWKCRTLKPSLFLQQSSVIFKF